MDVTFQLSWCLNEPPVLLSEQKCFLSPDADRVPDSRSAHLE